MKQVRVSVPGKILLMGEHAVVYGYPGIFSAMDKRLSVSVTLDDENEQDHTKRDQINIKTTEPDLCVRQAIRVVQDHIRMASLPSLSITIDSEIPSGYHLGTSAAVAVGTVAALLFALRHIWNPELVNRLAYEVEKEQHGTPSGIDNTAVTFGGFGWYRKELEFLKSVWQLPFKIPRELQHFYLLDTGKPVESTKDMVGMVRTRMEKESVYIHTQFRINEEQTRRVALSLKQNNESELLDAIRLGEATMEKIGVVSEYAQSIIREVEKQGGAAKILGGGGKSLGVGYLLCYFPHESMRDALKSYALFPVCMGEEGVRLEKGDITHE